jgi:hypothetical protein
MLVENFTTKQFRRLQRYILPDGVSSIECDLYLLDKKLNHSKHLLKIYKRTSGEYMGNKLLTINSLMDNKDNIDIDELVFPEKLAIVDKKLVGFTMQLIENNTNLAVLLKDKQITTKQKIEWLKQVGKILTKVQHVNSVNGQFLLGDIHESNFILNHDTNKIICVDLDGCKISNNKIYSMKYGSFNEKFYYFPNKYPLDDDDEPIPTYNTEWYCYTTMVLNMIANGSIHKLLLSDYYDYIQYLRDSKFPDELIDCFINIYTNHDNYSPRDLLEQIPNNLDKVSLGSFVEKAKINYLSMNNKRHK